MSAEPVTGEYSAGSTGMPLIWIGSTSRIQLASPVVRFKYDFDLLLRWLLKISYNDDRAGAPPYEAEPFVPYILGKEQIPYLRTNLLLGLVEPSRTSQHERGTPQNC